MHRRALTAFALAGALALSACGDDDDDDAAADTTTAAETATTMAPEGSGAEEAEVLAADVAVLIPPDVDPATLTG